MRWTSLMGWLVLCLAVGAVAGAATAGDVHGWYGTLRRPSFAPPNRVFAPVWSALYILMGVAAWRTGLAPASPLRSWAMGLFLVQLAANFAWPWLFFRFHALGAALAEISILWVLILATVLIFARISSLAAGLMVPYLAWVSYAAVLNAGFWKLN